MMDWTASALNYTNDFTIEECWKWIEYEFESLWVCDPPKMAYEGEATA